MAAHQKPQHICYYSNKCEWSRTFLTEIANTPYKSEFMYVCVDPSPNRQPLPTWLKKVPTLIVKGKNEPLVDSEVMNWLFERRLKDGAAHKPAAGGNGAAMDEPEPFMNLEMGSKASDIYSFLDSDGTAQGSGGARIQHNFEFINGSGGGGPAARQGNTIMTNHNPNRSKKEELFDAQMESYQRERSAGMPQMVMRQ